MACGLGLVAMLTGLWWADRGASAPITVGLWRDGGCLHVLLLGGAGALLCWAREPEWLRRAAAGGLALLLWLTTAVVTHDRLAGRLVSARVDERRAWAIVRAEPRAILRIEATVRARQGAATGESWLLDEVVGLGGGMRVPRRLLLRSEPVVATGAVLDAGLARLDALALPGERVRMGVRIRPLLEVRSPGGSDREHALRRLGVGATARLVDPAWVVAMEPGGLEARAARWRQGLRAHWADRIRSRPEAGGAGLIAALSLGDRRDVSPSLREALQRLGLAHLMALSGLHVGFVGVAVGWGLRRLLHGLKILGARGGGAFGAGRGLESHAAGLLTILAVWGFAWLVGGAPSVQRAAVLWTLVEMARVLLRRISAGRGLLVAGVILLGVEPTVAFDAGARLSFAACLGLAWVGDRVSAARANGRTRTMRARLGEALGWSLAAALATAPLVRTLGGVVPPWGPWINVFAIPLFTFSVLPLAIVTMIAAQRGIDLEAGWSLAARLERFLVMWAETLPDPRNWALIAFPSDRLAFACSALLVGTGLLLLRRRGVAAAAAVWILVSFLTSGTPRGRGQPLEVPRVVFLDVGQGDAALLQSARFNLLIDAGGSRPGRGAGRRLERELRQLGVRRLDLLVVTHGDWDHRAGARHVLESLDVAALALPAVARDDPALAELAAWAAGMGAEVLWLGAGDRRPFGEEIELEVVWPPRGSGAALRSAGWVGGRKARRRNEHSLVLRVMLDGLRYLFPADVGQGVEQALVRREETLAADVLKVGHHGSRGSTSGPFLEAVSPALLVLSAPCLATRGLPDPTQLARFEAGGPALAWTGRDGPVFVGRDPRTGRPHWGARWAPRPCPSGGPRKASTLP